MDAQMNKDYINEVNAVRAGKTVVAYDLDGTLADDNHIKPDNELVPEPDLAVGKPLIKSWNILINDSDRGYYTIIFTVRLNKRLWGTAAVDSQQRIIEDWLREYNYDQYINLLTGDKPLAKLYVDDRALSIEGDRILRQLYEEVEERDTMINRLNRDNLELKGQLERIKS